jgi:hypothetical protein
MVASRPNISTRNYEWFFVFYVAHVVEHNKLSDSPNIPAHITNLALHRGFTFDPAVGHVRKFVFICISENGQQSKIRGFVRI